MGASQVKSGVHLSRSDAPYVRSSSGMVGFQHVVVVRLVLPWAFAVGDLVANALEHTFLPSLIFLSDGFPLMSGMMMMMMMVLLDMSPHPCIWSDGSFEVDSESVGAVSLFVVTLLDGSSKTSAMMLILALGSLCRYLRPHRRCNVLKIGVLLLRCRPPSSLTWVLKT